MNNIATTTQAVGIAQAVFAGGCFWCTEAVFKRLQGVERVTPGYSGGTPETANYDLVSMGNTGHAEAIQVEFYPSMISYDTLLDVFFATHDPTTLNRQGADVGTEYRSAIFYTSEDQRQLAMQKKEAIPGAVTEVVPFTGFYPAENYHKDYYEKNRDSNPYCRVVIDPKIKKLLKTFSKEVREEYT